MKIATLIVLAFVLGSIPVGVIIAKAKGINLKKVGSGNIGATNVLRSLGRWPAVLTLLGDMLKGTVAIAMGRYFGAGFFYEGLIGLSAVIGHNFSIFLKLRGGKGVSTSLGVLILYSPKTALFTLIMWLGVVLATRYSSLGALISFGLLPLSMTLLDSKEKFTVALLMAAFVIIRHSDNIQRLLKRTERKIGNRA